MPITEQLAICFTVILLPCAPYLALDATDVKFVIEKFVQTKQLEPVQAKIIILDKGDYENV